MLPSTLLVFAVFAVLEISEGLIAVNDTEIIAKYALTASVIQSHVKMVGSRQSIGGSGEITSEFLILRNPSTIPQWTLLNSPALRVFISGAPMKVDVIDGGRGTYKEQYLGDPFDAACLNLNCRRYIHYTDETYFLTNSTDPYAFYLVTIYDYMEPLVDAMNMFTTAEMIEMFPDLAANIESTTPVVSTVSTNKAKLIAL